LSAEEPAATEATVVVPGHNAFDYELIEGHRERSTFDTRDRLRGRTDEQL
jgi:hypothetical protein